MRSPESRPSLAPLYPVFAGITGLSLVVIGCSSSNKEEPPQFNTTVPPRAIPTARSSIDEVERYSLDRRGDQLLDSRLADSSIKSLSFKLSSGNILMDVCLAGDGFYTILSREIQPLQGTLVSNSYLHSGKCESKTPVIDVAIKDEEEILIGVGNSPDNSYNNMRVYRITRTDQSLTGEFRGTETVDPKTLILRDR